MPFKFFTSAGQELVANSIADLPIGAIIDTGASTAPSGWLLCDGSAISRTGYADLFAALGTSYGVGDGSTTFNVPDISGSIIYATSINKQIALGKPPQYVTSLPSAPIDGQEIYYQASAASGIVWHFRYNASSPHSIYKWEFLGGSFLTSGNALGDITTTSTTDVNLTGGPTLTAPLTGEYASRVNLIVVSTAGISGVSFYVGATFKAGFAASVTNQYDYFNQRNLFFSSGDVINLKVNNANAVSTRFVNAVIGLCPVRVG